ncbi:MAG: GDSL-type esterase/lipase family protein [Proteobacteria bacterium]|nr:GDSL-type esterase/lipase family protein [Pseudomonadota bacterium]
MKRPRFSPALPLKTAWTVALVGALGLGLLVLDGAMGWSQFSSTDAPPAAPAGALPKISSVAAFETDAEILRRMSAQTAPHQPIEFRKAADIQDFVGDVTALAAGERRTPVRILHYGDSILTSDHMSSQVRNILQKKYGDGGHGFVLLGKPWSWYRHKGVTHNAWGKWRSRPLTSAPLSDGLYGLGGVAFLAEYGGRNTAAFVGTTQEGDVGRSARRFDISYLAQPGGGSFKVLINGAEREQVATRADVRKAVHRIYEVHPGPARLQIQFNNDGRLRVFGAAIETGEPGIVYDSLAINGARASALRRFDMEHWGAEINHREPSLLIFMFGANEGAMAQLSVDEYENQYMELLGELLPRVQRASCLLVGPLDQAAADASGKLRSKRMPIRLSAVQRRVAFAHNCAFFDTQRAMGGEGSMAEWYRTGYGAGDMIHPTEAGSRRLGNWLAEALIHLAAQPL